MIKPSKYLDLNTCVLKISSVIIEELYSAGAIPLEELNFIIRGKVGEAARYNFINALNFLFLLGKIGYDPESDAIFFIKIREVI